MRKEAVKFIYIANDGKQFENEADCRAYENAIDEEAAADIGIYDCNGRVVERNILFNADILIIKNKKAYQYFCKKYKQDIGEYIEYCEMEEGGICPNHEGVWVKYNEWEPYNDFLAGSKRRQEFTTDIEKLMKNPKILNKEPSILF